MQLPNNDKKAGPMGLEVEHRPRPKRERPWFPQEIRIDLQGDVLPNQIIRVRNWAIVGLGFQIVATVAGFAFFFFRRNWIYIAMNFISVGMLVCGIDGVLHVKKWRIALHGVITSAVLGVFFLYSILEALIREDIGEGDQLHMSEQKTLLLLSVPYLFDFFSGCVTFYLTFLIFDNEEQTKKSQKFLKLADEFELPNGYDEGSNLCCICMTNKKNTVIYPCGHQVLCVPCTVNFKSRSGKCPMCRSNYKDIIPIYE